MSVDLKRFQIEFDRAAQLSIQASEKTIKETSAKLLESIINSTPVKSGQLRGNWQVTLDAPSTKDLTGTTDTSGIKTVTKAREAVSSFKVKPGSTRSIFMANNLDYATTIEYGQTSQQAPYGMVRINVSKFQAIVDKEAKRNKI